MKEQYKFWDCWPIVSQTPLETVRCGFIDLGDTDKKSDKKSGTKIVKRRKNGTLR